MEITRIAVLSDIHANCIAFDAVLEDINNSNVDGIIIAGDYIGDGPQPNQVIKKLRTLKAWIIKGNKEQRILDYHNGKFSDWDKHNQMASFIWAYKQLDEESIQYISSLPEQISVDIPYVDSIRVVHGSPFHIDEPLLQVKCEERIIESIDEIHENVLICGHTHKPWNRNLNGKLILNPGSVGVNFNEQLFAEYALLIWKYNHWTVQQRLIQYDKERLEYEFYRSGLMEMGGVLAKAALYSMKYKKEDVVLDFIKYAYSLAELKGITKVLVPNDIWLEAELMWNWEI